MTDAIVPLVRPSFDGRIDAMTQAIRIDELSADAVTFVNFSDNRARIERAIECVLVTQPQGVWRLNGAA